MVPRLNLSAVVDSPISPVRKLRDCPMPLVRCRHALATGPVRTLGGAPARLTFGEGPKAAGAWAGRRLLFLDDQPAFELSLWCGTCAFLFERLKGATETMSMAGVQQRLIDGLDSLDEDVIDEFQTLLPVAAYL